jgi:hypothetical protein
MVCKLQQHLLYRSDVPLYRSDVLLYRSDVPLYRSHVGGGLMFHIRHIKHRPLKLN